MPNAKLLPRQNRFARKNSQGGQSSIYSPAPEYDDPANCAEEDQYVSRVKEVFLLREREKGALHFGNCIQTGQMAVYLCYHCQKNTLNMMHWIVFLTIILSVHVSEIDQLASIH